MSGPGRERLGRRQRWAGAVLGVGGLLFLASLVLPWFAVRSAGWVDREGFFLIFGGAPSTAGTIATAALGAVAALAGALSALGWGAPRALYIILTLLLLAAFVYVVWVLAQVWAQTPHVTGFEELIAPSWGLFFALAGPLIAGAGSLALAWRRG